MRLPKLPEWAGRLPALFERYKFALLVLLLGGVLLLLPSGGARTETAAAEAAPLEFSLEREQERLRRALAQIDGAGKVELVLTLKSGAEQVYARDETVRGDGSEHALVLRGTGSAQEAAVPVRTVYPVYQGAVVVCQGGDDPAVRLRITEAVAAVTGLGADRIAISRMKGD